jgi:hypothetical protein
MFRFRYKDAICTLRQSNSTESPKLLDEIESVLPTNSVKRGFELETEQTPINNNSEKQCQCSSRLQLVRVEASHGQNAFSK